MKMPYIILIILLLGIMECLCINVLPQWNNDASVEVYMLSAPLFKDQYDDLLSNINAFHAGLRFFNKETNEELIYDYNAIDMIHAVFPNITKDGDIKWSTEGSLHVSDKLTDYWDQSEYIYTVTGEQFNRFVCWAPLYNLTHPDYFLFDVFRTTLPFDSNIEKPVLASSSCISFVWYAFSILHDLGVELPEKAIDQLQTKSFKRDVLWFEVRDPPVKIDAVDPEVHQQLVDFYSKFKFDDLVKNMTWTQFMNRVLDLMDDTFYYYRANSGYYRLELVGTRAAFQYRQVYLPSGERNPNRVHYYNDEACSAFLPQNDNALPPVLIFFIVVVVCIFAIVSLLCSSFIVISSVYMISKSSFIQAKLKQRKYEDITVN